MSSTKKARAELQRFYTLTDQLRVQLHVLDDAVPGVRVEISEATPLSGNDSGDIMAIAFLVQMQASKSAQEDLRAVMEQVKAISAQKKKVRAALKQRPDRGLDPLSVASLMSAVTAKAETSRVIDELKADLDSMSELGEMESLRLQMAMDRMSKMMSTLSNILKKISCTASQITQNMK
ncbi:MULTISPECIES: hypothetical protein [unclassified Mycobacterium]|uniref:hypothetical protein n=1 Tax=unclassified Mycobacterium TaxID=2642494 RepID=UPI0029C72A6A|nr:MULTISPECIES: hypothetical protein [unclassified Mycobacterium]